MPATKAPIQLGGAPANATTPTPGQIRQRAWREAEELARSITGYDQANPIYGKPDLEVLAAIKELLSHGNGTTTIVTMDRSEFKLIGQWVDGLIARKGARQLAGVTYRGKK